MKSVTKLCLKALTRLNQTQSKLLNTICPKQELPSKKTPPETARATHALPQDKPLQQPKARKPLGTTLYGKDTKRGHHARLKMCRTPWRVDTTRRSPLSFPAVEGSF